MKYLYIFFVIIAANPCKAEIIDGFIPENQFDIAKYIDIPSKKFIPISCFIQGRTEIIENIDSIYSFEFDQNGKLSSINWNQNKIEKRLSKDEFAALAKTHKCGNGRSFEIVPNSVIIHEPGGEIHYYEGLTAEYLGHYISELRFNPNLDGEDSYNISCEIKIRNKSQEIDELCSISKIFCQKPQAFRQGGSRF